MHLEEFYERIVATAAKLEVSYELIFVNDGSSDASLELAIQFTQKNGNTKVLDLSRNFGHHRAIMTGLQYASGNRVFLIDCDLEEPPECLLDFWKELDSHEVDVVYGVQAARKGGFFEKVSGAIFYSLFNWLSNIPVPRNMLTARLMTRDYVKSLIQFKEQELFLGAIFVAVGYKQKALVVTKKSSGASSYTLRKKIRLFINSVTSFSDRPLTYIFYLGITISVLSSLSIFYVLISWLLGHRFLFGWPSLVLSVWFLGGLTLCSIGVLGIYLSKIFIETKKRPYAIIREIYN